MVIITGADGFIGQHLLPLVLKQYKKSEVLFLVGPGKSELAKKGKRILRERKANVTEINLVTKKNLSKLPESPKLIIHLAANTDTSTKDHKVNDQGTKNLIAALNLNTKTHLIYTSTTVLYSGRKNTHEPITAESNPKPTNEYGRTKLKAEEFLKSFCLKNKIPLSILRINTVYGNDPRKYKLFASLQGLILRNSILARFNWPGLTSIIHVNDVAETIIKIAKRPPNPGKFQTFLLYSENLTLAKISKLMYQALGLDYQPINLPKPFWQMCSSLRIFVPLLEKILPYRIYNMAWRSGLIVDDVIYCKAEKLIKIFPDWKPLKLKDSIKDTLV